MYAPDEFNPDDCAAEFIDGSYSDCGCPQCAEDAADEIESQYESGQISFEEAREAHEHNDHWF
ncbi:hypothetical protein [Nocardiopsis dassonvillei]|uniref:hypothetical protein n=1 Tax=Nocardiopsis dassonvillei TaxID=2014 RepID=UPI00157DC930|nr:hypothetical protein [Nocardiopsis dassonvillei]